MSFFRRKERFVPTLNTSSLPDLIFTVLFFFMVVTHMTKVAIKVKYQVPQGSSLTRLTKKTTVTYVYIGQPLSSPDGKGMTPRIQVNDKYVTIPDLIDYIHAEKARMAPEDLDKMIVSIKADKHTPMSVIREVKEALRQAKAYRIAYSADESRVSRPNERDNQ